MKITYDSNNKEDVQMVKDYYFAKYYMKSIYFDWKNSGLTKLKQMHIIKNHLNKKEFKRLIKILHKNFCFHRPETKKLLLTMITFKNFSLLHMFYLKNKLIKLFGEK
jgi:hypothetical protein